MMPIKKCCFLLCLFFSRHTIAQDTAKLTLSAAVDAYYSHNTNNGENAKPSFFYNHTTLRQLALNFGFVKAALKHNKYRANLAAMAGTYVQNNMAAEPDWAKPIYEANAGVKISKQNDLWLDVGVMPSHIGFESANSRDCYTLTRSILADNSPYYETGIKLTYTTKKQNLTVAALVVNGWQRIARPVATNAPSFGTQLTYKPKSNITFNYSTYIGKQTPTATRMYHNVYYINEVHSKWNYILGLDVGMESGSSWQGACAIVKYIATKNLSIAARAEVFKDNNNIITASYHPFANNVGGFSTNVDYKLYKKILLRTEWKTLVGDRTYIYPSPDALLHNITMSVSVGL